MAGKLQTPELEAHLASLTGWEMNAKGEIERTFEFPTYKDGLIFASVVGFLADRADHHPDLLIGYQKVTISLISHDVGGLSKRDFALAEKINSLIA